jgi:hypothetical protein
VLLGPHRSEAKSAAPRYSPGLVQSNEYILRTILDPEHLRPDGSLKTVAMSLDDIRFRGWSVDRKRFTSVRQLRLFHRSWKERKPGIDRFYVVPVRVKQVRFNFENRDQDFVVTDAAICRKPCHAMVLRASAKAISQSQLRQFRDDFLRKLPKYVEVGQAYETGEKYGYLLGMARQAVSFLTSFRHFRTWRCLFFSRR